MNNQFKVESLLIQDDPRLVETLDGLKGSYAVEYILEALLRRGNTHTLQSALKLIRNQRK